MFVFEIDAKVAQTTSDEHDHIIEPEFIASPTAKSFFEVLLTRAK
jgi:hypothetical protein